jgi:hypothetical protein
MKVPTAQQTARHECGHAVALAVRTGTLTESIYVGCNPDGTSAAGINGNSKIPFEVANSAAWIVYYFAGHAAEKVFDAARANREGALRDDVVAEKILRATWQPYLWDEVLTVIETEIANFALVYRACIEELAAAVLTESPRAVAVLGEERLVYKLCAHKIEEILTKHGLQTRRRFGGDYTDEQFTRLLERHDLNVRIAAASPMLAAESYSHRRFAEAKRFDTLEFLDHQTWANHYGTATVEVLGW